MLFSKARVFIVCHGRMLRFASLQRAVNDRSLNWALLDQATVSGVNFLTMVLLARYLGVQQFGTFMLAWLVLLFFKSVQGGLIVAPMMSIGPKHAAPRQAVYYGSVVGQQIAQAFAATVLFLVGFELLGVLKPEWHSPGLAAPVAAAILADQLQEFVRRYLFTRDRALYAFGVDMVTYGIRMVLLLLLLSDQNDSRQMAFWIVSASSAVGIASSLPAFGNIVLERAAFVETVRRHWHFAKWTTTSAVLEWGSGHFIVMVAGSVLSPAVVGAIRATTNVFAPIQMLTQALNNAVPIRASRYLVQGGETALRDYLCRVTLGGLIATGGVLCVGGVFAEQILHLLYGPDFAKYAYLIQWWIVIYAVGFLQFPLRVALRTIEFTRPFFVSIAWEAAFGLIAAFFLPHLLGINGAMLGILVTRALPVLVLGWYVIDCWRGLATEPIDHR